MSRTWTGSILNNHRDDDDDDIDRPIGPKPGGLDSPGKEDEDKKSESAS